MSQMTQASSLDASIQLSNEWLDELSEVLDTDRETAYGAMRRTLEVLRGSLTVDEAAHLAAQLPMMIRGIYFTGWKPSKTPLRHADARAFLENVRNRSGLGADGPHPLAASRAMLQLSRNRITAGEIQDVLDQLPAELTEALDPGGEERS